MSEWLARARARRRELAAALSEACAKCANSAKTPPEEEAEGRFGTFGTIGTGSGISPAEVRGRFEWTLRRLQEEHGLPAARAREQAGAILRAELRNDPRLVQVQQDPRSCVMCGRPGDLARPLVPVLSPHEGEHLWLHLDPCHGEYVRQQGRKVDQLMISAGVG